MIFCFLDEIPHGYFIIVYMNCTDICMRKLKKVLIYLYQANISDLIIFFRKSIIFYKGIDLYSSSDQTVSMILWVYILGVFYAYKINGEIYRFPYWIFRYMCYPYKNAILQKLAQWSI